MTLVPVWMRTGFFCDRFFLHDVEVPIYHGTSIVPSHVHFRVMYPSCGGKIKIVVSDVEYEYEGMY